MHPLVIILTVALWALLFFAGKIDLRFGLIGLKMGSKSVKCQFHENTKIGQTEHGCVEIGL